MKKQIVNLFVFFIIILFFSGCAGIQDSSSKKASIRKSGLRNPQEKSFRKSPGWVLGKTHPKYSESKYVKGVGVSMENAVSANESARAELAKVLKVKINSIMKDFTSENGSRIESLVKTEVNTILEGIEIKDGWVDQDKGTFYSLAVLDRRLAADGILKRVEEIEASLKQHVQDGLKGEQRGDVLAALSNYLSAYHKSGTSIPLRSALRVITRKNQIENTNLSTSAFQSKIEKIVRNLRLEKVSGDSQSAYTQSGPSNPLVVRAFLQKDIQKLPVEGLPLFFSYQVGRGEIERERMTDSSGKARSEIQKISSYEQEQHVISAKLNYPQLISLLGQKDINPILKNLEDLSVTFSYLVKMPKWSTSKSTAWRKGITELVNQMITNLPPKKEPLIGVLNFIDLRYGKTTPFSRILKEDFETLLVQGKSIKVKSLNFKEKKKQSNDAYAKSENLDFYIVGSYRLEQQGLEIRSRLIETRTNNITSSGNIQVGESEINPEDLELLKTPEILGRLGSDSYDDDLENIIYLKPKMSSFKIKVWANRKEYQIGEDIIFYAKAERDCYLILFDVGPKGDTTVIFPNAYHKDNFVKAGVTIQIPQPNYGFKFNVQGPAGLERIKAFATLTPELPIDLDYGEGFHSIKKYTSRGTRDIKAIAKNFSGNNQNGWTSDEFEIFIFHKDKVYFRGSRKIPLIEKPVTGINEKLK